MKRGEPCDLRLGTWAAVDTETTGLKVHTSDRPFAVGLHDYKDDVMTWEWPVDIESRQPVIPRDELHDLATTLMTYDWIVFHNSLFDRPALNQIGVEVPWHRVHDTMLMAQLIDSGEVKSLKKLANYHFDVGDEDEDELLEHAKFATSYAIEQGFSVDPTPQANYWLMAALVERGVHVPGFDSLSVYLEKDVLRTALLWQLFREVIVQKELEPQYQRDMGCLPMYEAMSRRGMRLSKRVPQIMAGWQTEIDARKERLEEKAGVSNVDSPACLRQAIYGRWKLSAPGFTPGGDPSTDKNCIERLAWRKTNHREWFLQLLEYRAQKTAAKYVHSYLGQTDGEGVLRASINPTGTHTTRTSSSNPNGQNVAKHTDYPTRQLFAPREGFDLWAMDYDQLEVRLFAWASQDETLLNELSREGGDVHAKTASIFGVPRRIAKNINFGWLYGAGKRKLSALAGVSAAEFMEGMANTYPDAVKFMKKQDWTAKRVGRITTLFGTPLEVDRGKTYSATNYTIQGSAGDAMKYGIIAVWEYLEKHDLFERVFPLMLVHDELVFEVKKRTPIKYMRGIKAALETPGRLLEWPLPVDAEKSSVSWGHMESVEKLAA